MPSLCHSWLIAIGETIAARASGFFKRIKIATFATLTRRKLPQFQVATFGKTQGGQHPTTNIIFNIATQHLTKKLSHEIRRGMRPFQNTMRNITLHKCVLFQFENTFYNSRCENVQNPTLNRYSNFGTPQINHNMF
jgi:hypothetical protein